MRLIGCNFLLSICQICKYSTGNNRFLGSIGCTAKYYSLFALRNTLQDMKMSSKYSSGGK
jgi:hypothetical protein